MRRIRRRSESNVDDFESHKQLDSAICADHFDIVNPLRCQSGVHKLHLKRTNFATSKRNLLREPILRLTHDNHLHTKCVFGSRGMRRMFPLNFDERSRSTFHKPRSNSIKSSIGGNCSFRDLISECNILLDESKSKKAILDSTWQMSKNFQTCQKSEIASSAASSSCEYIEDQDHGPNFRQRPIISTGSRLSCSQEASNNPPNSRNGDDVTIVELASYFDTMVHIPKKMSSMAEMMYI
ncbi:GH13851 [Drosophila grimshawi]|uniref:Oxidative stress-responsive serine-rich protein 1 n=2 Tax=Drosophila grimshawi TaxID=7222 RepID=B4JP20_DROGR|nr:GH13851 [Drosophila grimshawi]